MELTTVRALAAIVLHETLTTPADFRVKDYRVQVERTFGGYSFALYRVALVGTQLVHDPLAVECGYETLRALRHDVVTAILEGAPDARVR